MEFCEKGDLTSMIQTAQKKDQRIQESVILDIFAGSL